MAVLSMSQRAMPIAFVLVDFGAWVLQAPNSTIICADVKAHRDEFGDAIHGTGFKLQGELRVQHWV